MPSPCTALLLDLASLAAVGIPILLVKYLAEPVTRGFFCSDESLRHPYSHSTISTLVNVSVSYGVPTLTIVTWWLTPRLTGRPSLPWRRLWAELRAFLFGALLTQMVSGVTKQLAGRLRPHFVAVCRPTPALSPATCGSWDRPLYLTDFTCQGDPDIFPDPGQRERYVREARLSFPSGHASLACFGMVYCALFLQWRLQRAPPLPRGVAQALLLIYAVACCVSRVTDHKHHPGDVLAGAALGSGLALAALCWCTAGPAADSRSLKRVESVLPEEPLAGELDDS